VVFPTIERPLANPIAEASRAATSKPTIVAVTAGAGKSCQSGRGPKTDSMVTSHAVAPKQAKETRRSQVRGSEAGWRAAACKKRSRAPAEGR